LVEQLLQRCPQYQQFTFESQVESIAAGFLNINSTHNIIVE